ncbi:MAG: leucine-rich repeat protein, partial [Clostridia bacterium]|nr:leucine-rich repeat protein [Clostridia bacterium]
GEVDGIMANILFELPAAPLKEKCTFLGWSLSQDSYIPVPIPFFTHYITTTCYAFWEDDFFGEGEVITFVYDSENDGYTVTAVSHPFYQRQIAIPETYDDGTNGEKPVFRIGDGTNPVLAETLVGGTGQNQIAYLFLPQSIIEISDYAFANSPLRQIIFSEGLETIGVNAFNNCSLLEGVLRLPSTLSYIGEAAFAETPNIKEVVFAGSSLEYLGEWAFANSGLTFINLPDVEILSQGAFYNCRLLREIIIPSGVKEIGAQVFYGTRLYSVTFEESIIDGIEQGIILIGDQAFACNTRLYEIHFPVTIKVIGEVAFSECENLTIVTFAEGTDMIGIGAEAFAHCALLSIDLPSGLAEIADYTFNACFYLNSVSMPDTVTHIGAGAFKQTLLKEISLSSGLVSIGDEAFVNTLLQRLVIPASVESIGLRAFGDDDYLREVIFEEGSAIQTIGERAFEWCPIIYVSLPNGLRTIGSFAFSYCEMSEIFISTSVVFIGDYAFNNCSRLSKLTFADRSQLSPELKSISIGQYAFQRTGILQVILPEGFNSLSSGIFNECKKLKSVEIRDESLVSIGAYAFSQCVAMLTLTLYGAPPDLNTLAFNSMNSDALIYVLVEFLNAYKTASVWSTYADRIFEMPQ